MSQKDLQFIERALAHPWMFWVYFWKWPRLVRQACAEYDLLAKERDAAKAAHERSERANKIVRDWIHVTHRLSTTPEAIRAIFAAGKRLSILLVFFVITNTYGQAPPYLRNQWTTNANPLALKVISTNGVHAATNVWELDFTNTATVTVSAVSNANKVMVSFTGSASSGSSSLTNALLHAGPTNGSVDALILTAGNGVTLTTSGTNRVIASTGQPASANLTNWSNTSTSILGSLQTPWVSDINAARFSLTNFDKLVSKQTNSIAGFTIGDISDIQVLTLDAVDVHSNAAPVSAFGWFVANSNDPVGSQSNQVLNITGYNLTGGGARFKTNESAYQDTLETSWDTGGNGVTRQQERYYTYISPDGTIFRLDQSLHRWNVAGRTNLLTQRDFAYQIFNLIGVSNNLPWCTFNQGENNGDYGSIALDGRLTTSSNVANRGGISINHGGDVTFNNQFQSKVATLSYPAGSGSNFFTIADVISQQTNRFQDWREVEIRTVNFANTKLAIRAGTAQTDNLQNWKAANDTILSQISSNGGFQTLAGINVGSLVDPGRSNLVVGLNFGLPSSAGSIGQVWTLTNVATGFGAWSTPTGQPASETLTNLANTGAITNLTHSPLASGQLAITNGSTAPSRGFKSLQNGSNITLTDEGTNIVIASTGGGSGIGSIFTNNVLAGGPGLTELEFTNTATVTANTTTNAGRVTVSFDAPAGVPGIATNNGTGFSTTLYGQTNFGVIVFTNGARIVQFSATTTRLTNTIWEFHPGINLGAGSGLPSGVGFASLGANDLSVYTAGTRIGAYSGNDFYMLGAGPSIFLVSDTNPQIAFGASTADTILTRDAANVFAMRAGVSPHTNRVYGAWTNASNGWWVESGYDGRFDWTFLRSMANGSATAKPLAFGVGTNWAFKIVTNNFDTAGGAIVINNTVDTTASTGMTINKTTGRVRLSAGNQTYLVTNNLATANSIVTATINSDDTTALSVKAIPAAGMITLKANAATTADTDISFFISAP